MIDSQYYIDGRVVEKISLLKTPCIQFYIISRIDNICRKEVNQGCKQKIHFGVDLTFRDTVKF